VIFDGLVARVRRRDPVSHGRFAPVEAE
jgi:hypothetical protein